MTARESTAFTTRLLEGAVVVEAHGELDTSSVSAFRTALQEAAATGRPLVVVDLEHVAFIDSAGLSVVFGVQRQLPVDQRLVLGNVPARMLRTLRLASVTSVLEVHAADGPQPWRDAGG
jgi:anti-sigma B factor antagonist